ncbi:MAG: hypothetical protein R3B70_03885 [Polyangiaceae bacterium]
MFDSTSPEYLHARLAVKMYSDRFLRDPNCWGVGVGAKMTAGADTGKLALVVLLARKRPKSAVPLGARLPETLDVGGGLLVPVDVVEAGPFFQHENTARIRPAQPGTSVGNVAITAGTFGAVVVDPTTGKEAILSNNHVLADNNRAAIGSDIVQPGPYDGGAAPKDVIAKLTRFVPIVPEREGNNKADVAIATAIDASALQNVPLNGVPRPSEQHPGVGLLWGGDGATRSTFSPLKTALGEINARLPPGGATWDPAPGLDLQKSGRTTERTTGRIQEVHATLKVYIPELGGTVVFVDQFTTTLMSQGGDSGSVAVTLKPML